MKLNFTPGIRRILTGALLPCTLSFLSTTANGQPELGLTSVINTGLSEPMQFVNAGDGSHRTFIVQKGGTVRAYDASFNFLSTFVTVPNVDNSGERGLLSMVFHPDYLNNGLFYVYYVRSGGSLELARFHVSEEDDNLADPGSEKILITIPHPTFANHNGGELHFGNDGFLYLSTGDGGSGGDPNGNAQNTSVLLGKILRFDVNTSDLAPYYSIPDGNPFGNEIFDLGLRNPYRWSFDRQTNDMWIGDVGQDSWEEINFRPAGATGGVNYGWRCYEGNVTFNTADCGPSTDYVFPVHTYATQNPSASITGGVVYRGAIDAMKGYYMSADFFSGTWYLIFPNGSGGWVVTTQSISPTGIVNFGEDELGEVYAISLTDAAVYQVGLAGVLPLTLLDFTATPETQGVRLRWVTTDERNVERFEVEYSMNGYAFENATTVPARNESSATSSYDYYHPIVYNGNIFYRLKMIDRDGRTQYSNIVKLNLQMQSDRIIVPSLITNGTLVAHLPNGNAFRSLEVIALDGKLILQADIKGRSGQVSFPLTTAARGMYVVRIRGEQTQWIQKINIQ